jgi:hypothetical protein
MQPTILPRLLRATTHHFIHLPSTTTHIFTAPSIRAISTSSLPVMTTSSSISTHREFVLPSGRKSSIATGLFINDQFVPALGGETFECVSAVAHMPLEHAHLTAHASLSPSPFGLPRLVVAPSSSFIHLSFTTQQHPLPSSTPLPPLLHLSRPTRGRRPRRRARPQGVHVDLGPARPGLGPGSPAKQARGPRGGESAGAGGN